MADPQQTMYQLLQDPPAAEMYDKQFFGNTEKLFLIADLKEDFPELMEVHPWIENVISKFKDIEDVIDFVSTLKAATANIDPKNPNQKNHYFNHRFLHTSHNDNAETVSLNDWNNQQGVNLISFNIPKKQNPFHNNAQDLQGELQEYCSSLLDHAHQKLDRKQEQLNTRRNREQPSIRSLVKKTLSVSWVPLLIFAGFAIAGAGIIALSITGGIAAVAVVGGLYLAGKKLYNWYTDFKEEQNKLNRKRAHLATEANTQIVVPKVTQGLTQGAKKGVTFGQKKGLKQDERSEIHISVRSGRK